MLIDLTGGTRMLDLIPAQRDASGECCDLCRVEAELFRLVRTADALCEGCFVAFYG